MHLFNIFIYIPYFKFNFSLCLTWQQRTNTYLGSLSVIAGQMLSILASRGLCHLRELHSWVEGRHLVWHIQPTRLGTHLCPGKQMNFSLSHSSYWVRQWRVCLTFIVVIPLKCFRYFTSNVVLHEIINVSETLFFSLLLIVIRSSGRKCI